MRLLVGLSLVWFGLVCCV